jgi:hypothetical protein
MVKSAKRARFRPPGVVRKRKLLIAGGASAALAVGALSAGVTSASAASTPKPAVTFTGTIRSAPAHSSRVIIEVELTLGKNTRTSSARLEDKPVAAATVHGARFSVAVPRSAVLARAETQSHGVVNYRVLVVSGSKMTALYVPAPHSVAVAAARRNASDAALAAAYTVHVPALPAFRAMSPAEQAAMRATSPALVPPPCIWTPIGSLYGDSTRIGEAHVANVSGVSDFYSYQVRNDQTISVAISVSPTSNYTGGGSIGVSNSLDVGGGHTFPSGSVQYVVTTGYYQRYQSDGSCGTNANYKIQETSTGGDVSHGTNTPALNPWGSCQSDQLRVVLQPGSQWNKDVSKSQNYSSIATIYNFQFSGSDGFTTDVDHQYTASSSAPQTTYICGTKSQPNPTQSTILYNTP